MIEYLSNIVSSINLQYNDKQKEEEEKKRPDDPKGVYIHIGKRTTIILLSSLSSLPKLNLGSAELNRTFKRIKHILFLARFPFRA